MKILITIGLLILAANVLVVLMVVFVLARDWVRDRKGPEPESAGAEPEGDAKE